MIPINICDPMSFSIWSESTFFYPRVNTINHNSLISERKQFRSERKQNTHRKVFNPRFFLRLLLHDVAGRRSDTRHTHVTFGLHIYYFKCFVPSHIKLGGVLFVCEFFTINRRVPPRNST